jgi:regulator of sirC expression with transglutaminase-like and TPR domain
MDLAERWSRVVAAGDDLRLDEAALVIAAHIQPEVDVDREIERLDALAAECRPGELASVVDLLFHQMRLHGDTETYDDPLNSSLPSVLDRQAGIPISLSVLLIEVGRRVGIELQGVGMPGHFLVRRPPVGGGPAELLDPFGGARALSEDQARLIFPAVQGTDDGWAPADMLAPTPPAAIVTRMLANLTASYTRRDDLAGRRWVAELRAELEGASPAQQIGVASELAATGAYDEAADLIDRAAEQVDDPDAVRLRAQARGVRSRLN